jgi:hypothetical protein
MEDKSSELNAIMDEIRDLPRTKPFSCCGRTVVVSTLNIRAQCPVCNKKSKLRRYDPIGTEIQDLIDEILKGMGTGKELELVTQWKKAIDQG